VHALDPIQLDVRGRRRAGDEGYGAAFVLHRAFEFGESLGDDAHDLPISKALFRANSRERYLPEPVPAALAVLGGGRGADRRRADRPSSGVAVVQVPEDRLFSGRQEGPTAAPSSHALSTAPYTFMCNLAAQFEPFFARYRL
jgi:hypothetical protein